MKDYVIRAVQKPYFACGIIGLMLVWLGQMLSINRALTQIMPPPGWQIATGLLLLATVIFQWALFYHRLKKNTARVRRHYQLHKYSGLFAVLLFALHAARVGYGWTLGLFIVFVAVVLTGLLNREIMRYRAPWLYRTWLWLHVSLSAVLISFAVIHAVVGVAYK